MIEIRIKEQNYNFKSGITLEKILSKINVDNKHRIVAAIVDNKVFDLSWQLTKDCQLRFLRRGDVLGNRIYRRSLLMVLARAVYEIFPDSFLSIEHSLGNGIYCELYKDTPLVQNELKEIKLLMRKIINKKLPFERLKLNKEEVLKIYEKQGFEDKIKLIQQMDKERFTMYELDGFYDYFFYHLVPDSGYLDKFDLHFSYPGFVLLFPQKKSPDQVPDFINQPQLANVFMEYEELGEILGVGCVNELNKLIEKDEYGELIRICEALHEKNIAKIADEINEHIENKQIILIAGPSSSGKTTFTHRLAIQLKINGLRPVTISTDDYFVNRGMTPVDEDGNCDYEALEAIDLELLNNHLIKLLAGEKVEIPSFNFQKGKREYNNRYLQIEEDQPLLVEGIHGLNERLTRVIPQDHKFKIYVSALTQINIDRHNRIPTTDTRMLRRIIRDHKYRGQSAVRTIKMWPSVRKGETRNIFPYQENADIMFNSALIYELAVLKKYAVPLLKEIDKTQSSYYEARRLLEVLNCFKSIPDKNIPNTSILREFIGDSVFR